MLCFLRALDADMDGSISEADFCHCVEHGFVDGPLLPSWPDGPGTMDPAANGPRAWK